MIELETETMTNGNLKMIPRLHRHRGFSAIEIAMVAAVIAILSLIVLPIYRNRVEDAKIAAAQADLNALMKAQQVVKADIDAYARLEDLDNVELNGYTAIPAGGITNEVPNFLYRTPSRAVVGPDPNSREVLTPQQRQQLAGTENNPRWRGPYIAFQRFELYGDLVGGGSTINPNLLYSTTNDPFSAIQDQPGAQDSNQNRIPVDPWGNPYLFFPPNGNSADPNNANGAYSSAAIYSLGPDGMPGDGGTTAQSYTRGYAVNNPTATDRLGAGDDLMVEF